ncbi:8-amino-7-oxononanoate synthase [Penicillium samsonianum]|uniref:8-amino-7-oxononanoate synthase n=1 Tax=Penicillium samsonianum TaxID=1882272 RepID=UPI002547472B|nr:8-amino-7-oxononanoate synthase [Penicillium samsonianum]KAJ6149148.1 8-amino-7-oxononanoate synthase [Penicillium samsonianum]
MSALPISSSFVAEWAKAQQTRGQKPKNSSVFYRNLEEELDISRAQHSCAMLHNQDTPIDFSSCDVLGIGQSGALRAAFLEELDRNPSFQLGAHGTRLLNGNSKYLETVENEVAELHGAETALIVNSSAIANDAIFSAIPLPGDAIVYDELIHASALDGFKHSVALCQKSFRHNDVGSFVEILTDVKNSQPQIRNGTRCVIIAVESFYSMDGDVCPLQELIEAAKETFPDGNAQFVMDEAHSSGHIGPNGAGLVSELGLEKEVAVRNHTLGKTLCGTGGVILCNSTIRKILINRARPIMFSIAPSFPLCAATRVGYKMLRSGETMEAQSRVQHVVKLFLTTITSHPVWDRANDAGILRIPLYEEDDWDSLPFVTQICPIWTRPKHNFYLAIHLQLAGYSVYPISFPVVPKGSDRIRIIFHAQNTDSEIQGLAQCTCEWAEEMLQIQRDGGGIKLPAAARHAYSLMTKESLNGSN